MNYQENEVELRNEIEELESRITPDDSGWAPLD